MRLVLIRVFSLRRTSLFLCDFTQGDQPRASHLTDSQLKPYEGTKSALSNHFLTTEAREPPLLVEGLFLRAHEVPNGITSSLGLEFAA